MASTFPAVDNVSFDSLSPCAGSIYNGKLGFKTSHIIISPDSSPQNRILPDKEVSILETG